MKNDSIESSATVTSTAVPKVVFVAMKASSPSPRLSRMGTAMSARADGVDAHHNVARFGWELVPAGGGESIVEGFDVAVTADDGRIGSVLGFLDKAPAP